MPWPCCPKCGSRDVVVTEIWDAGIEWSPGEPQFNDGLLNLGDPLRVEGKCSCGHAWKFRGIVQVKPEWFEGVEDG